MKSLSPLLLIFLSFLLFNCEKKQQRPNIIFILADDLGYNDLGCYGATQIATPNIDMLAAEGIRFTEAHSPCAVCTPTRYAVLTGRYCWRSRLKRGVLRGYDPLLIEEDRMTVASMLKKHGYATACVGKWHLGFGVTNPVDYSQPLTPGPNSIGFNYFFGIPASLDMPPYCFVENTATVGTLGPEKYPYNTLQRKGPMTPGWKDEEVGPTFVQKAVAFIEDCVIHHPDQPFFLYFPYQAPHTPCTPPDFIRGKSQAGVRGDMVVELDWAVAQIRKTLEKLGVAGNTLIFLTSDNGALTVGPKKWENDPPEKYDLVHNGHRPNGNLRGQKGDAFEGGHKVPFIAHWPGKIKAGTTSQEIISLTDFMATCAAIVGEPLTPNMAEDSYDISPALLGKSKKPIRQAVVAQSSGGYFAIQQGEWKLINGLGSGGFSFPSKVDSEDGEPAGQLYNITSDPYETQNLWQKHPDVVQRLSMLLKQYQEQDYSRKM